MRARIYQHPKSAMQSGRATVHGWILEWYQAEPKRADPLMGWIGSGDMQQQITLTFPTREEAVAYAEARKLPYDVEITHSRVVKPKAYGDNFRTDRAENWTH
jgi:hypothetical protein